MSERPVAGGGTSAASVSLPRRFVSGPTTMIAASPASPVAGGAAPAHPPSVQVLPDLTVFGMDEVGRGALAGPLVAALVALSPAMEHSDQARALADSKTLTEAERTRLDGWIRLHAEMVAVHCIGPDAINSLGIGWANRAIYGYLMASAGRGRFVVDGNLRLHQLAPPGSVVICRCGGDSSNRQVAAASIIAKVYRDRLLRTLHEAYPAYGWVRNVGYATAEHRRAIVQHGPCAEHRTLYLRRISAEEHEE